MKLITQINELYQIGKYDEVIACSLRSIFDLAIFELTVNKIEFTNKSLEDQTKDLINWINGQNKRLEEISKRLKYTQLKNEIQIADFKNTISICHLGAHKATQSISRKDIEKVGKDCATFVCIVNELLNSPHVTFLNGPNKIKI